MDVSNFIKLALVLLLAAVVSGCSETHRLYGNLSVEDADRFDEFDLYWLGEKYEGERLDSLYRSEPYQRPRNDVTLRYGPLKCDIDSNCVSVLEIVTRPYCDMSPEAVSARVQEEGGLRWFTHYQWTTFDPGYREIETRGVKAWLFGADTDGVLYVWTGRSALVLSGDGGFSLKKAANNLRSMREGYASDDPPPLPPVSVMC